MLEANARVDVAWRARREPRRSWCLAMTDEERTLQLGLVDEARERRADVFADIKTAGQVHRRLEPGHAPEALGDCRGCAAIGAMRETADSLGAIADRWQAIADADLPVVPPPNR